MGLIKDNDKYEWHGVKCADCAEKHTIKLKIGALGTSRHFDARGVYTCKNCKSQSKQKRKSQKVITHKSQKVTTRKSQKKCMGAIGYSTGRTL